MHSPEELLLRQLQQESSRGRGRRSCVMLEGRGGRRRLPAPRRLELSFSRAPVPPPRRALDTRGPIVSFLLTFF